MSDYYALIPAAGSGARIDIPYFNGIANLPENRRTIPVRTAGLGTLKYEGAVEVERRLGTDMLNARLPFGTQLVESQAVRR